MRYQIYTYAEDYTGFEANTIGEAIQLIYNEFWWTGDEWIYDTEAKCFVVIVHHTDCTVGHAHMVATVRG